MASSLFRSLSQRMLDRKARRSMPPPPVSLPAAIEVSEEGVLPAAPAVALEVTPPSPVALVDEAEAVEEAEVQAQMLAVPSAATPAPSPMRRRPSIFRRRLHERNVSTESTATTASTRSTASSLAGGLSRSASGLGRSVSTRAKAAHRRSMVLMAAPTYEGRLIEDDSLTPEDEDGAATSFDIIL